MKKFKKPKTFELALKESIKHIKSLACEYKNHSSILDYDDLVNIGMLGLFQAYSRFQNNETTRFTTFAYFRVKGAMLDEVRKFQLLKRSTMEKIKFEQAKDEPIDKANNNLLVLADYKNVSMNEREILDNKNVEPIQKLIKDEKNKKVKSAIDKLNSNEARVLNFRYNKDLKLKEVGDKLKLSEARVHQIQKGAMDKLRYLLDEEIIAS